MPVQRTLNQDFFKKWSPAMAYVLGYFAADGSMIRNRRGAHFVEFTSTDKSLILQVKRAIGSNHNITVRKKGGNAKTAYRLQLGSKQWFNDLSRLGFTQSKSKKLALPPIPSKMFSDFVRGYFDGDGCVYAARLKYADRRNKRDILMTLFTSGSHGFLTMLWASLKERGLKGGSLRRKTRGFELVFSHRDSLALYRLMYHTAGTSDLFLPRKRRKLERAVKILGFDK